MNQVLLPAMLLIPLLGALVCALSGSVRAARGLAILVLGTAVLVGVAGLAAFDWQSAGVLPVAGDGVAGGGGGVGGGEQYRTVLFGLAFEPLGFSLALGADGLSLLLAVLTPLLALCAVLAGGEPRAVGGTAPGFPGRVGGAAEGGSYYAWLLVLVTALVGVWTARDLLLFYAFFELILVPLFFLIGTYGGPDRRVAATKLFIYTFTGSILALPAILYVGLRAGTFDIAAAARFAQSALSSTERTWVLLGLLASFCVKTPIFPLHTWQPTAMSESPANGVVDCVGLVLKLGAFAILKIAVPIGLLARDGDSVIVALPGIQTLVAVLAVVGIIYGALCAWVQTDAKRLLAYSSLSHVGFVVLGIMALNDEGVQGAGLYLINTAITTGALFLVVGMVASRFGTRDLSELSGLGQRMPIMAFFLGLFTMASIGLPLLNGFVSEWLTVQSAFTSPYLGVGFGVVAALGMVLSAVYMLTMAARLLFGPEKVPAGSDAAATGPALPRDLSPREVTALLPLALLSLVLGVYPGPVLTALKSAAAEVVPVAAARSNAGTSHAAQMTAGQSSPGQLQATPVAPIPTSWSALPSTDR